MVSIPSTLATKSSNKMLPTIPLLHEKIALQFRYYSSFLQWENTVRRKCEYGVFQITSRRRVIWKIPYSHFRSHSIHIVENYKNSWNCSKMTVFFMFTLCKMARKTHVHTLQWCFLKNSSNRRKVWTWVFLATLQSVNMTNCSTVSVL